MASARRGEDRVERRFVRPAAGAVALDDLDIVVAEPLQAFARDLDQFVLAFDRDRPCPAMRRSPRPHSPSPRRPRARCSPGLDAGRLDHQRDDVRLRNRLPRLDRQRMVAVGEIGITGPTNSSRGTARNASRMRWLVDPAALQLPLDHRLALGGEVCHGFAMAHLGPWKTRKARGAFR